MRITILVAAALTFGCTTLADPQSLTGRKELVEVDGRRLPISKGRLPQRDGSQSQYNYILARGHLDLRPDHSFQIYYEHQNSATRQVLARTDQSGTYALAGNRLILEGAPQVHPSGRPNRWEGTIAPAVITIQFNDERLVFRR